MCPILAEREAVHTTLMTFELANSFPGLGIPEQDGFVGARRGQALSIRAKCQALDCTKMALESPDISTSRIIPKQDLLVSASGKTGAIRADSNAVVKNRVIRSESASVVDRWKVFLCC